MGFELVEGTREGVEQMAPNGILLKWRHFRRGEEEEEE